MKKIDWAYFAGLFDGEGCVDTVCVVRRSDTISCKAGQFQVNASLRIANNDPRPLLELENFFGGSVRPHSTSRPDSFVWICHGNKSIEFARNILPFVRIKYDQLELYLALKQLRKKEYRLSDSEKVERINIVDRIRASEYRRKNGARLISMAAAI